MASNGRVFATFGRETYVSLKEANPAGLSDPRRRRVDRDPAGSRQPDFRRSARQPCRAAVFPDGRTGRPDKFGPGCCRHRGGTRWPDTGR